MLALEKASTLVLTWAMQFVLAKAMGLEEAVEFGTA
tara:strand:+ start:315 stop:422 length:108 start_codon:yes stop_codon:yes gene_type:complete